MTGNDHKPRRRLKECVVECTIAIVESEAARLRASQALALGAVFTRLALEAVEDNILGREVLRLALKAQSQSRATPDSLVTSARPRVRPSHSKRNFDEQTIANGNYPA